MSAPLLRIVFHGENAASFEPGFAGLLTEGVQITQLPDHLLNDDQRAAYAAAEIIIGARFNASLPTPTALRLFLVPGAGYDAVDLDALPSSVIVCNCFGHEPAIAEYVMGVLLRRAIPLDAADSKLREGDWSYWAGAADRAHGEIAGLAIGLLGFGHIGKAVAVRARAFGMRVNAANRSVIADTSLIDQAFLLSELPAFWASADVFVVSLPLDDSTRGLVGSSAFAAMPNHALLINVGRGPVVDEQALFSALQTRQIAGAAIDTWYSYPVAGSLTAAPSSLPFHMLPNLLMTPHMSGWTQGTIRRRQATMAENIERCRRGDACINVVR